MARSAAGLADSTRRGGVRPGRTRGMARGRRTGSGVAAIVVTPLGVRISHIQKKLRHIEQKGELIAATVQTLTSPVSLPLHMFPWKRL